MRPEEPIPRRRFFAQAVRELLRPLAEAVEPLEQAAHQLGQIQTPRDRQPGWLRPPGAINESVFAQTCIRSGNCVRVCPAQCIKIDPAGGIAGGAPYIEPDIMPCVLCDGLLCMHTCPSRALLPTELNLIRMGTAEWNDYTCLRSSGENCTICIDRCPIGTAAIELSEGKVLVHERGCVGCGVCQHDCPTNPKSIVVRPHRAPAQATDSSRASARHE